MLSNAELADARMLAESTMTATVQIAEPGDPAGGWDPVTGPTPGTPGTVLWQGRARVQAVRSDSTRQADAAGQAVTVRTYKVALPHTAALPPTGSLINVTAAPPEDPYWAGSASNGSCTPTSTGGRGRPPGALRPCQRSSPHLGVRYGFTCRAVTHGS